MEKGLYIKTFGCQMNERDSRQMEVILSGHGYAPVSSPDEAKLILVNTCTIREKACDKAMSDIGRLSLLKAENPELRIGICGCMAQQEQGELLKRFPFVDFVVGPDQVGKIPELAMEPAGKRVMATELIDDPGSYVFLDAVGDASTSCGTAFVTIMKGCNYNCTYCIVPSVRGREVCRDADDIVNEVQRLVDRGVKEIMLLGQTVDAYRVRKKDGHWLTFAGLIQRIAHETDIVRIRFTSPHPLHIRDDLIDVYRSEHKLCSHIHLPLQSGSNRILKTMRRGYSRERYLALVERLREARPGLTIGTDIIVGFCGEDDVDFRDTLDLVEHVGFDFIYAFAYSPRPGTIAAEQLPDDVPDATKKKRLEELLALGRLLSRKKNEAYVGSMQDVLITGRDPLGKGYWTGRTSHNRIVNVTAHDELLGKLMPVRITQAMNHSLVGELVA